MSHTIDFATLTGNYSLEEQDTGYTWIDGKRIYKKTVSLGACPNKAEKRVSAGISNFDKLIKLEGIAYSDGAVWCMGPSMLTFYPDTPTLGGGCWSLAYSKASGEITLTTAADRRSAVAYATLYYTKN